MLVFPLMINTSTPFGFPKDACVSFNDKHIDPFWFPKRCLCNLQWQTHRPPLVSQKMLVVWHSFIFGPGWIASLISVANCLVFEVTITSLRLTLHLTWKHSHDRKNYFVWNLKMYKFCAVIIHTSTHLSLQTTSPPRLPASTSSFCRKSTTKHQQLSHSLADAHCRYQTGCKDDSENKQVEGVLTLKKAQQHDH